MSAICSEKVVWAARELLWPAVAAAKVALADRPSRQEGKIGSAPLPLGEPGSESLLSPYATVHKSMFSLPALVGMSMLSPLAQAGWAGTAKNVGNAYRLCRVITKVKRLLEV